MIYILLQSTQWCMKYHVILDRVITSLECTYLSSISWHKEQLTWRKLCNVKLQSMAQCNTAVSTLLTQCRYCSLPLRHQNVPLRYEQFKPYPPSSGQKPSDDMMTSSKLMETFSALLALYEGNPPVTGGFPHIGQRHGALVLSLMCAWINSWVNNREAGDLRRYRALYDVSVMIPSK